MAIIEGSALRVEPSPQKELSVKTSSLESSEELVPSEISNENEPTRQRKQKKK